MQYKASAECKIGGDCVVRGEVSGTLPLAPKDGFTAALATLTESVDAGSFSLDVSDSSVDIADTGLVTIKLVEGGSGTIQASKIFAWNRIGSSVVLADPAAVNAWASANGATADSVLYDLHEFKATESPGWNTLAVAAQYDGLTEAYATTTWRTGQICPGDPKKGINGDPQGIRYCP